MKKQDYKLEIYKLLDLELDDSSLDTKIQFVKKVLIDYQKDHEDQYDVANKGKPWTDEQLKIILSDAPTKENCAKYAALFKRGYGSIEQIYRWAATPINSLEGKGRSNDSFVLQIKKVARQIGLRG